MLMVITGLVSVISFTRFRRSSTFTLREFSSAGTVSSLRVSTTLYPLFSNRVLSFSTIDRLMSFSRASLQPTFPGSLPPCPASRTIQVLEEAACLEDVSAADARASKKALINRHATIRISNFFFIEPALWNYLFLYICR